MRIPYIIGLASLAVSGCLQNQPQLTPAQDCAIGYDMAQQIYKTQSRKTVVIHAPKTPTKCESYALQYLRKSGFAIEPVAGGKLFDITITPDDKDNVLAVATLPNGAQFARLYRPGPGGVYATSALSHMQAP